MRTAIIGLGVIGKVHANLIAKRGDEMVAFCDIEESRAVAAKEKWAPNAEVYTDYKEMLDSGLCDAVLVEVPHYQHPEMVMECLKRGINVICEKPAGVYTKQVKEMNAVAEKSDKLFLLFC